ERVQVGDIQAAAPSDRAERPCDHHGLAAVDQRTAQRGVVGALPAAGVYDHTALEIEDRHDPHRGAYHARIPGHDHPAIGLDVGGANTKAAVVSDDGRIRTVSEPFEVWRELEALPDTIGSVVGRLELDRAPVALT